MGMPLNDIFALALSLATAKAALSLGSKPIQTDQGTIGYPEKETAARRPPFQGRRRRRDGYRTFGHTATGKFATALPAVVEPFEVIRTTPRMAGDEPDTVASSKSPAVFDVNSGTLALVFTAALIV